MSISRRMFIKGSSITSLSMGLGLLTGLFADSRSVTKGSASSAGHRGVIPYPQFQSWGKGSVGLDGRAGTSAVFLAEGASSKEVLAAEWIERASLELSGGKLRLQGTSATKPLPGIYILNWNGKTELHKRAADFLDESDRRMLADSQEEGQGYVIRMLPEHKEVWLVGAAPQGALYAAATLVQLTQSTGASVIYCW